MIHVVVKLVEVVKMTFATGYRLTPDSVANVPQTVLKPSVHAILTYTFSLLC